MAENICNESSRFGALESEVNSLNKRTDDFKIWMIEMQREVNSLKLSMTKGSYNFDNINSKMGKIELKLDGIYEVVIFWKKFIELLKISSIALTIISLLVGILIYFKA